MTGREIAQVLRQNRKIWGTQAYYANGKYCVIGLLLKQLGVDVESWDMDKQQTCVPNLDGRLAEGSKVLLSRLQRANDFSRWNAEGLISWCEIEGGKDFPIEELARLCIT